MRTAAAGLVEPAHITQANMNQVTNTQRQAYVGLLEDKFQIGELKSALALAEQRVAAEILDYDARCATEKRGFFREIAASFSELF
jgi:hypothetical protein